ncbi:ABC-type zinc uptake system zinc chaperone [Shewanella gaetbuli]|uniref:ABC-type zinc uptake system zinc chaperone n=1 Tax=Shewanella gaetbuli TaxID=220752 RepID=A0A9X1ZJY8_9GAMM|nr:ABC-type zinc uptake system zinc chaperone [Shewanella gaetbuli]
MKFNAKLKQNIAIWLSAILLVLAFAASKHSVEDHDHGVNNHHCTLCFHKFQLNKVVHSSTFKLEIQKQQFHIVAVVFQSVLPVTTTQYHSRAPPAYS